MRVSAESAVRVVIATVVGTIGAAAGFAHTHSAALHAGQTGWLAWADAVVIESMVVVGGLQLARDRQAGRRPLASAAVVMAAFLVQMGSQVALAPRTPAGWLFAAVPALGCLIVVKFGLRGSHDVPKFGCSLDETAVPEPVVAVGAVRPEMPPARPVAELAPAVERPAAPVAVWPPQ